MNELSESQNLALYLSVSSALNIACFIYFKIYRNKITMLAAQAYQVVGVMSEHYSENNKEIIRALDYFSNVSNYGSHKIDEYFLPFYPHTREEEKEYIYQYREIGEDHIWLDCNVGFYHNVSNSVEYNTRKLVVIGEPENE
jgi:hypothetical protein